MLRTSAGLGVASVAERVSFYRKDGRVLRILRSPGELKGRTGLNIAMALRQIWSTFEEDLQNLQTYRRHTPGQCIVLRQDGRTLKFPEDLLLGSGQVTLMVYSPPYLNHIDYAAVALRGGLGLLALPPLFLLLTSAKASALSAAASR